MQRLPDHPRGRPRLRRLPRVRSGLLAGGLAASVLLAPGSGAARSHPRTLQVLGGTAVAQGELPFLAFLRSHDSSYVYSCTGTLIAPNVVLTAGHCAYGEDGRPLAPSSFSITLGAATPEPTGPPAPSAEQYGARSVTPYSSTANTLGADVAVIVLSGSTTIVPVSIATGDDAALEAPGATTTVAGWGLTSPGGSPASTLQKGAETIQGNDACLAAYPSFDAGHELCAASPAYRPAVCNGDSGGPLLVSSPRGLVEVGVVSYSLGGCGSSPDYYARVSAFADWISAAAAAGSAAAPVSAAPVYAAPGVPQAGVEGSTLSVAFAPATSDPATTLTGYGVTLRTGPGSVVGYRHLAPAVTATTFAGLPRGLYTVEVQALYSAGSSSIEVAGPVAVTASTSAPPTAPAPAVAAVTGVTPPAISGVRRFGSSLSCSRGTWSWEGAAPVTRVWLRNGRRTGSTGPTYRLTRADEGGWISCRATLRTPVGDVGPQTSARVRIADLLRLVSAPEIVGRRVVGSTLTCTRGDWRHTGPVAYRYSWLRGARTIARGQRHRLVAADAGRPVRCVVRASGPVETEQRATAPVRASAGGS